MNRTSLLLAATTVVLGLACGQPQLIDRTQPNYIKKSDLLSGTFYLKETIVDAPKTPGAGFSRTVGSGGVDEKIRWEIQEGLLVAYRAYEITPGADPLVDRENSKLYDVKFKDGRPYKGNPVLAFPITSHFDRQRIYNPATGEQTNVLVEDSSDRPWFEREYIRVNWSRSTAMNPGSCNSDMVWSFQCGGEGSSRQVTSEDQRPLDEAMVFEYDTKGLRYFDWTNQRIIDPPSINYPGYGRLPLCLFNGTYDCESMDVKVRTSVLRVDDADKQYEPLVYNDRMMTKFGFFRQESVSYTKDYYYTLSGRQQFAMRHNIWESSRDAQGKTLPVVDRTPKPVVYYMTNNTPKFLREAASMRLAKAAGRDPKNTIEASWDHAFRRTVAVPRGRDASRDYNFENPGQNEVGQMFYVCESPVPEGAPAACGKPGTYVRIGDIRYNTIPYVEQNAGGLLGLGPSMMDPESGRVVSAAANVYGTGLDWWAGGSLQAMEYLMGELTLEELVMGKDARNYVFANLNATDPRRPATGPWTSQQPLESTPAGQSLGAFGRPAGPLASTIQKWMIAGELPRSHGSRLEQLAEILKREPALEAELLNADEVKKAVGSMFPNPQFQARLNSDASFYRQVAKGLIFRTDPMLKAQEEMKKTVSHRLGCFNEFSYSDEDYEGVARRKKMLLDSLVQRFTMQGNASCANQASCTAVEAKTLAKAEVYNDLRREAYRSVTEHEIGHTVGLRHNFIGSADALNYQDGYWDLRKETIGVVVGGQRVMPITPQNMLDAAKLNANQIDKGLYEYTYSSIMDYGARVTAQNKGLGKYDDAAIMFAYAGGPELGWVEVFNQFRADYENPNITLPVDNASKVLTIRGAHTEIPLAHLEHYTPASSFYSDKFHYSTLPFHFADFNTDFDKMLGDGIKRMNNRSFRKWSEMKAQYDVMDLELKDFYLSARDNGVDSMARAQAISAQYYAKTRKRPQVEVPYMFCSDGESGWNMMCNANDQGADPFEMTTKWMERFNQNYVFSNFRRDRYNYDPIAVVNGRFGRYLANIPNVYQQWLSRFYQYNRFYQTYYGFKLSQEQFEKFINEGDPMWQNYWTMAVMDSTNLLMQQMSTPSVGYHGKRADGIWEYVNAGDPQNRRRPTSGGANSEEANLITQLRSRGFTDVVYVPRGPGRSTFSVYDTFGYDSFYRVNEVGHFWDTFAAILTLSISDTQFSAVDRGGDALRYDIPYYQAFGRELGPLFSAYWRKEEAAYAPMLAKQADGTALVVQPTFVRSGDYVVGFNYPPAATTPVDSSGAPMQMNKVLVTPSFTARFYAQLYSMATFKSDFRDKEYVNFNQVFRLGSGDSLTPEPGFGTVQFADPFGGGFVYAALVRNGTTQLPAGPATIQKGRDLYADLQASCPAPGTLQWNRSALACCADNQCANRVNTVAVNARTFDQIQAELREQVRILEMMRGLYRVFGD